MTNNYAFIVTSALNTKFGVFNSDQRLGQTLDTIRSIRNCVPGARIIFVEMAALPMTDAQQAAIGPAVDQLIDFTQDLGVQELYHSTDNWDVVKNVNEVTCFASVLRTLAVTDQLDNVQRIFKISGRYQLNDHFDLNYYDRYENSSMIVLARERRSHFHAQTTGNIDKQFMSRLWSWPHQLTNEIIDVYDQSLIYMFERLQQNGYADIEHTLYKFLDHDKIRQIDRVGVSGNIGPNGVLVED